LALEVGEEEYWIDGALFESILDRVRSRKEVRITFDDSNESDFTVGMPALQARGMKATFFMVARRIGGPGYVLHDQLKGMVAAGMEIGSHGMRHRPWRGLAGGDLKEELVEAKECLERMSDRPMEEAACPWGSYDRRVLAALRNAGFKRVYTSDQGPASSNAWLQARTSIMRKHDLAAIDRMIENRPGGIAGLWRSLKLTMKRWR
jgi:peptidoglycan/xylan/chitin deacetylase (PgdA/CDA1 family)